MRRLLTVFTILGGLALTVGAHASSFTFNISGTGTGVGAGFAGSGVLTTSLCSSCVAPSGFTGNIYSVTGITGNITYNGSPASSITGIGSGSDQFLYVSGNQYFDTSGLTFNTSSLGTIRLYSAGGSYNAVSSLAPTSPSGVTGLAVVATTPEPSSFALLGTGLLGAAGILRRRILRA